MCSLGRRWCRSARAGVACCALHAALLHSAVTPHASRREPFRPWARLERPLKAAAQRSTAPLRTKSGSTPAKPGSSTSLPLWTETEAIVNALSSDGNCVTLPVDLPPLCADEDGSPIAGSYVRLDLLQAMQLLSPSSHWPPPGSSRRVKAAAAQPLRSPSTRSRGTMAAHVTLGDVYSSVDETAAPALEVLLAGPPSALAPCRWSPTRDSARLPRRAPRVHSAPPPSLPARLPDDSDRAAATCRAALARMRQARAGARVPPGDEADADDSEDEVSFFVMPPCLMHSTRAASVAAPCTHNSTSVSPLNSYSTEACSSDEVVAPHEARPRAGDHLRKAKLVDRAC